MPLIVYALGAYISGLFAGFTNPVWLAAAAVIAVFASRYGLPLVAAYSLLCAGGFAIARSMMREEVRCAASAERATVLRMTVDDSVGPGGFSRGRVTGCVVSVA